MSVTKQELARQACQTIETCEKVLAMAFQQKKRVTQKESCKDSISLTIQQNLVWWDVLIKRLTDTIQKKAKELLEIYDDVDGDLKSEQNVFSGQENAIASSMLPITENTLWTNFYSKINEIDNYHGMDNQTLAINESLIPEAIFAREMEQVLLQSDRMFTGEESHGKYFDLHSHYLNFRNIKKLRQLNIIKADDYLTWLQNMDKFTIVPLYIKQSAKYEVYVEQLCNYLKDFFQRTNPLVEFKAIHDQTEEMFEQEWEQRSLFGWEQFIPRIMGDNESQITMKESSLFCQFCNKSFLNENVFHFHKKGKRHIKAVNAPQPENIQEQSNLTQKNEFTQGQRAKLMSVARFETWILRLKQLMNDIMDQTVNQVRKKQSSSYQEIEAERRQQSAMEILAKATQAVGQADSDDEDKLQYNPKSLPMGWDGKPIPYWLYKLHGLGQEFKCEICGGASYWGRRAFEKHFQEWRHAYGMKCLRIPNSSHFKDVTEIEHALKLHKKILQRNFEGTFKPDFQEEFEDGDGNLYSRKQYIDMKRQGLI